MHSLVESMVSAYLAAADAEAPGLIEGLYLTGSVALGDFRPRTSDIDYVAITRRPLGAAERAALARVHAGLRARRPRPALDGLYVTWAELAADPAHRRGPYSHEGRFCPEDKAGDPVTWHTLARHGVARRGPAPAALTVWAEPVVLAAWTLDNLDRYWGRLLRRAARLPDRWGLAALTPYGAAWIVLGVSRLHYTLATGAIASKAAAGHYALRAFPEARWLRVVEECLRIRESDRAGPGVVEALASTLAERRARATRRPVGRAGGEPADGAAPYRTPFERRRDVLAFGAMVIADAERRFGGRSA